MPFKITEVCIGCGTCLGECPTEAIAQVEDVFVINPQLCNNSSACVDVCPVDAIVPA